MQVSMKSLCSCKLFMQSPCLLESNAHDGLHKGACIIREPGKHLETNSPANIDMLCTFVLVLAIYKNFKYNMCFIFLVGGWRKKERERERDKSKSNNHIWNRWYYDTKKQKKSASIGIVFWDAKQVIEVDLKRKNYRLAWSRWRCRSQRGTWWRLCPCLVSLICTLV